MQFSFYLFVFVVVAVFLLAVVVVFLLVAAAVFIGLSSFDPLSQGLSHIISLLGNKTFHLWFSHVTPSDHLVPNCSSVHFTSFSESRTVSHVPSRVRRAAFSLRSELESDSNHTSLMK